MNKQHKSKLKTLPNELTTQPQEFAFKSQCEDEYHRKVNLASPTFGTENEDGQNRIDLTSKENRINLSLKQYKDFGNQNVNENGRDFRKSQGKGYGDNGKGLQKYQKMEERVKVVENENKQLIEEKMVLFKKYEACKKKLQQKYSQKVATIIQMGNGSQENDNIDLYLEVQAFRADYTQCKDLCEKLKQQNKNLSMKIEELQEVKKQMEQAITVFVQKSEKKKCQSIQLEQNFNQKVEQVKRKYENKYRELQNQKNQQLKNFKKIKSQFEKIKFLKQEIEKKRQQDLRCKQQLEQIVKEKQSIIQSLSTKLTQAKDQYKSVHSKLISFAKNQQNFDQQIGKYQQELNKIQRQVSSLKLQNSRNIRQLQDYKLINQKYSEQITKLLQENKQIKIQREIIKKQLQLTNSKFASTQECQRNKIHELQIKVEKSQKQIQEITLQFQKWVQKNTSRVQPFEENEKEIQSRLTQQEKNSTIKSVQQKFNNIINELNKQIENLKRSKQNLELELDSERQKYDKVNNELQNTYRKFEQFNNNEYEKQSNLNYQHKSTIFKKDPYSSYQTTISTKATPQLKMIKQILLSILGPQQDKPIKNGYFREKQRDYFLSLDSLIDEIKKMAEQVADFFDERSRDAEQLFRKIQKKEQVISKLLKFTPQQKKSIILDYLKVMQDFEQYSIDQVYKVTKTLQEQACEWKKTIINLIHTVQKNEQELNCLRKQVGKYKSEGINKRYEQPPYYCQESRQKIDRHDRDRQIRNDRYPEKWEYHRRRH